MKEAIRMVLESIYDPEFPDTKHFRSGRGCHSALRRIKEEWGTSRFTRELGPSRFTRVPCPGTLITREINPRSFSTPYINPSRWFLEFDIRKSFHTIGRHRLIPIFKEEIDDPKFFYSIQKVFSAGRLVGGEKGPYSVPRSILLSALPGNIYLHKLDQEIGRIQQKYEIPIVKRIRSVLLRAGRIDDQENSGEERDHPQDKRTRGVKSIQLKTSFHSLVLSWHTPPTSTPRLRGDQKRPFVFPPSSALAAFLKKPSSLCSSYFHPSSLITRDLGPSSLLCAAFLIEAAGLSPQAEFYGREGFNWAMRDLFKYFKRKGLLIELGGEARLVLRSERGLARKLAPFKSHYLIRISYARYADDLLLGIVGAVELLIEIQKRIAHFLQSGLNLWVGTAGSTRIAGRSTVEFLGTVIREVPPRTTPIQFFRELEKRLRVKHRIHITACHRSSSFERLRSSHFIREINTSPESRVINTSIHSKFRNLGNSIPIKELTKGMSGRGSLMDGVPDTLGRAGVRSPQVSVLWGNVKHIRQGSRGISLLHSSGRSKVPSNVQEEVSRSGMRVQKFSLYTPAGWKAKGEEGGHWAGSINSEFPIQIEAPIKKILRRLRDRGIISRGRPWPIHVACLTNVSDGDIVNWSAGIAISPLSYYRCRDNLYQVRTIVDYQIRWSAIFTLAHKHKSSARNIIQKYSKDSNIVNQEDGKTLAEFPNSIELGKLRPGQDPNNKEHSTTSHV
uniref:Maturase n=2 Tax=Geranium TaxID=4028 RepID=A0A0G3Y3W3_9ROSI|nr:maturase R [Geranium brycei]AKM22435.1 maturase R [Geranium incanum]AKM22502.1 maturase [Geranium brycei]